MSPKTKTVFSGVAAAARRIGVSSSMVSKVLHGAAGGAPRVRAALEAEGYDLPEPPARRRGAARFRRGGRGSVAAGVRTVRPKGAGRKKTGEDAPISAAGGGTGGKAARKGADKAGKGGAR